MKDPILVIFMRTDLNMSRGKMAVQAGHAVASTMYRILDCPSESDQTIIDEWMENNQVKIVLAVNSLQELTAVLEKADMNDLPWRRIYDAGKTEVEPNTVTCGAVGIAARNRLQKITSGWKALK